MNLNFTAKVLIICLGLLEAVSSTPDLLIGSDNRTYLIESEMKFNWQLASDLCTREGYQLVTIDSDEKNAAIITLLNENKYTSWLWTGGTNEFGKNETFVWSATGNEFNFTFWEATQPDNMGGSEQCVQLIYRHLEYKWDDYDCGNELGYICEVNHFKEACENDLKTKCDKIESITSLITSKLDAVKTDIVSENTRHSDVVQNLEQTLKSEITQLQSDTQTSIQEELTNQLRAVRTFITSMNTTISDLKTEVTNIKTQLDQQLNEKQADINKIC